MSDSTSLPIEKETVAQSVPIQELTAPYSQFLTVSYNPAAHPKQITLLDANGQPVQYTLTPFNQNIPVQIASQLPPNNIPLMATAQNIPPNANVCFICGSQAVDKCSFGISHGRPCGRLLCLTHIIELSSAHGGRYPHCPEHYQHIQQNKCNIM
jgi:hypothetical protein